MASKRAGLLTSLCLPVCLSVALAVDFDGDFDADQGDFGHFQICLSGSGQSPPGNCLDADLDTDGDVDQQDLGIFQACMGGASMPLGEECRFKGSVLSLLDEDTDLDLSGQIVYAVDAGGRQRYGPITVGGAVFLEDLNGDGPYPPTPGIVPGYTTVFQHAWNSPDPTAPGLTHLKPILGTWGWQDLNAVPLSCQMDNIVPGQSYTLQLMWADGWWYEHTYMFDIYVDGQRVADNVAPQLDIGRVGGTNLGAQGLLFTHRFVATDTQLDVELRHAGSYPSGTGAIAFLSGLLLTTPSDYATYPRPFNNSVIWNPDDTVLKWFPGSTATSHDVYFGTNSTAVANANHGSAEYKGNQELGCVTFDPRGYYTSTSSYYWRVDEVTLSGTYSGPVWSFHPLRVASDPDQPAEARAADLVSVMTLEEKVAQMVNQPSGNARVGIPRLTWQNECLHGILTNNVSVFPQSIALASMWHPDLMYQVANAISDEARALYNTGDTYRGLTYWSPTINIARDPRWGRTQETYGEDPHLTAETAKAFVRGLQGDDPKYLKLVSTPKHFAANNEEWRRTYGSATISERWLREYYLPHFRKCVVEAGAFSVIPPITPSTACPAAPTGTF